jgi:hypothetical protein
MYKYIYIYIYVYIYIYDNKTQFPVYITIFSASDIYNLPEYQIDISIYTYIFKYRHIYMNIYTHIIIYLLGGRSENLKGEVVYIYIYMII